MGLDLKLLPLYSEDATFSHDLISCERDEDLFLSIIDLEENIGIEVDRKGINAYCGSQKGFEGECYGKIVKTPHGETIKYIIASVLFKPFESSEYHKNRAIGLFLKELPHDLPVYLYWH